ncbi:MAG: transcription-repair coupling factor [Halanaerobiales bacterium]
MILGNVIFADKKAKKIVELYNTGKKVRVNGLTNCKMSFFCGNIYNKINNHIVFITYDNFRTDLLYEDLIRIIPEENVLIFPSLEVLPHEQIMPDYSVVRERLQVLTELAYSGRKKVIITPASALMRKLIPPDIFKKYTRYFETGKEYNYKKIIKYLYILGYKRADMVEEVGDFSVRGGIIDVFPLTDDYPYRLEFFGDELESIRSFAPDTQRSITEFDSLIIPPAREFIFLKNSIETRLPILEKDFNKTEKRLREMDKNEEADYLANKGNEYLEKLSELQYFTGVEQFLPYFYNNLATIFSYIDKKGVFVENPERVGNRLENHEREINETQATLLEQGSILSSYIENFAGVEKLKEIINNTPAIYFAEEYEKNIFAKSKNIFEYKTRSLEPYHSQLDMLSSNLKELLNKNYKIIITLNTKNKVNRFKEFLEEKNIPVCVDKEREICPKQVNLMIGSFSEGFVIEDINLVIYTEKEVFGKPQKKKRKLADLEKGIEISSLNELKVGDYVVHENHGIGKYKGIKTLEVQDQHQDYLVIQYADEDKLYVPTEHVDLVQKYIGADQKPPKLYKLGGSEWKKVKQRVKSSVREMAIGLLELYAERETIDGYAFSPDTVWQKEFEDVFPYQETPDQIQAIEDVKKDMESNTPMDRLLCGDVGYGKTEVAIRAAFKAAMDQKQTAVLVPTTILAQQHFNTFRERIDKYPINVEMISRFRSKSEQKKVLKKLARGKVDIIIGTHRLLSKDVVFNDLGLLIIDEEQRFGVSHKEKLKDLKRNVDVLTLTATPIPRTLHMALVGVRDMSVIETPPENRYPIRTYIREFNKDLIKETIRREMNREGQVYFVHNRVEDIDKKAAMISDLLPEARVAVAHGQMNENKLEKIMFDFYNKEYDVLVCTTIIENGLDIPNVNTIIINRAENMGLAQLYQLRGRVGRSNRVAYAYLLYQKDRVLSEVAEKRLKAIKEFTNLGSGFKIAMRDLEIRGAGNLLGAEQHGHIASIGFSLYCKLLESAIEDLKGEDKTEDIEIEVNLSIDAYIPEEYITDSKQKIDIYKKIKRARSESKIIDIVDELLDRFGDPPQVVMNLIEITRIKITARKLNIEKINEENGVIKCYFSNMNDINGEAVVKLVDEYQNRIKIRSSRKPVIGIKTAGDVEPLKLVKRVLKRFYDLM